jgi:hypothetical protein
MRRPRRVIIESEKENRRRWAIPPAVGRFSWAILGDSKFSRARNEGGARGIIVGVGFSSGDHSWARE